MQRGITGIADQQKAGNKHNQCRYNPTMHNPFTLKICMVGLYSTVYAVIPLALLPCFCADLPSLHLINSCRGGNKATNRAAWRLNLLALFTTRTVFSAGKMQ